MIVKYPNPILLKPCADVDDTENISHLITELKKYLKSENAAGIAANQIGVSKNVFLVCHPKTLEITTVINPIIISYSTKNILMEEGCLSFPGQYLDINRPVSIVLSYSTEDRIRRTDRFSGALARIILHEYDHLKGIVFTQYMSPVK